jgi:hypothetical protein
MNLVPFQFFIYFNYLVYGLVVILPLVLARDATTALYTLPVVGLLGLGVMLMSQGNQTPKINLIPPRIVLLVNLVLAIFLSFSPYLLTFASKSQLVWSIIALSVLQLILLIITDFKHLTETQD